MSDVIDNFINLSGFLMEFNDYFTTLGLSIPCWGIFENNVYLKNAVYRIILLMKRTVFIVE